MGKLLIQLQLAIQAINDKKGYDTVTLDVRKHSSLTDYYIITSGLNSPHLKALFNETQLRLKENGVLCHRKCGSPESGWIMADYMDFIIHFFSREQRAYYDLDQLWQNAPKVKV